MTTIDLTTIHTALTTTFKAIYSEKELTVGDFKKHRDFQFLIISVKTCIDVPGYDCCKRMSRKQEETMQTIKHVRKALMSLPFDEYEIEICLINGFLDFLLKKLGVFSLSSSEAQVASSSVLRIVA